MRDRLRDWNATDYALVALVLACVIGLAVTFFLANN